MAEIMDDIAHLTQDIGPHPAGTEEEQQAALYLAERIQNDAGFSAIVEDFQCVTNDQAARLGCFGAALLSMLLALILPIASLPCFILALAAAVLYVLEITGRPVISRLLRTGASQNVVAKYQPARPANAPVRRRKVILVANYDSGKALMEERPGISRFLPILQKVAAIALIVAPVALLLRMSVFSGDSSALGAVMSFLMVVCAVLFVLPVVRSVLHVAAPFNQSANNNAAGVAVLVDVACKVGRGLVASDELAQRASAEGSVVRGEQAARAAGVVPDGTRLEYDEGLTPQESLAAAKAAIAALTGKPVADKVPVTDISSRLVKGGGLNAADDAAASEVHFEVGEPPAPSESRREASRLRRTMVPMNGPEPTDSPEPASEPAAALAGKSVDETAEKDVPEEPAEQPAAAEGAFRRETPVALQDGLTGASSSVDKTPSWARSAQAKARANKPEAAKPRSAHRSRYADTPAAQIQNSQAQPASSYGRAAAEAQGAAEPELSGLSARLAALRSEIEQAEAPHAGSSPEPASAPEPKPAASSEAESATPVDQAVPEEPAFTDASAQETPLQVPAEPYPADDSQEEAPEAEPLEPGDRAFLEQNAPLSDDEFAEMHQARPSARGRLATRRGVSLSDHAKSLRSRVGALTQGAASFASSIRKPEAASSSEEPEWDEESELPVETTAVMEPIGSVPEQEHAAFTDEPEGPVVDAADGPTVADEPAAKPASPGATAAMSPIDVSAFLDKERPPEAAPVIPAPSIMQEETQRVSSEQIQEAIHEVNAREINVPPREDADMPEVAEVASPVVGMEEMIPQVPLSEPTQEPAAGKAPAKQVIVLPDVVVTHSAESNKQRAPMAAASESTQAGTKSLLSNMLPSIEEPAAPAAEESHDMFGLDLPPLGANEPTQQAVSLTGSFAAVGGTGSFAPVGDELVADIAPEDRYVDDADDSAYDEDYTETGAFAGQGYVDMPKSRASRLFDRFRKNKKKRKDEDVSVREWVDVDESYNARSVGQARGDWSSFREEAAEPKVAQHQASAASDDASQQNGFVDIDYKKLDFDEDRREWNGGAFSLNRLRNGETEPLDGEGLDADATQPQAAFLDESPAIRMDGDIDTAEQINRELRKLQDFRHPDIDTEVWFVALGSELYGHSGMTAFMAEHADELKGAVIVNLEALGAGSLSYLESEGVYRTQRPSSRVKRIVRQASERSGVACRAASIASRETPASIAMAAGHQAFTICGVGEGNTALYAAENDVFENIDEEQLEDASNFVMSILKSV